MLVCDEPVSALDVSVQAQVVNLLRSLQRRLGIALVFIAHDLAVVRHISDRTVVMYLGQVVETADTGDLFDQPSHPYTQALLSASPQVNRHRTKTLAQRVVLRGAPPSPADPPSGCRFHTRCHLATAVCVEQQPVAVPVGARHVAVCHHTEQARPGCFADLAAAGELGSGAPSVQDHRP